MIIRTVPEDERDSMELKVYAAEVLKGKRANWGFNRKWEGHYLAIVSTCFTGYEFSSFYIVPIQGKEVPNNFE